MEEGRCVFRRLIMGRQMRHVAGVDVAEKQVVVTAARADAVGDDPLSVARDRRDPDVTLELEGALLPALEVARDDVEVHVVPAIRRIRERPSGGVRRVVLVPLVDDERLVAEVELCPLVTARRALDEDTPIR